MQASSHHPTDQFEQSLLWEMLRANGDVRQSEADDMARILPELEDALARGGSGEALECAVLRAQIEIVHKTCRN